MNHHHTNRPGQPVNLNEIMQSSLMKSGSTNANASEANDQAIIQKVVPALKSLADLADNAPNNDARGNIIKRFLLSLYNAEF
jgi:hypothetical protein